MIRCLLEQLLREWVIQTQVSLSFSTITEELLSHQSITYFTNFFFWSWSQHLADL